ncbi:MAG: hypothetical protein WDK96_01210 [Candidatus Paceibacterota bacterium]
MESKKGSLRKERLEKFYAILFLLFIIAIPSVMGPLTSCSSGNKTDNNVIASIKQVAGSSDTIAKIIKEENGITNFGNNVYTFETYHQSEFGQKISHFLDSHKDLKVSAATFSVTGSASLVIFELKTSVDTAKILQMYLDGKIKSSAPKKTFNTGYVFPYNRD